MPETTTPKNRCQTPLRCTKDPVRRRRTAFTLAEVMIAIGILGVGMAMVASVFPAAIKQNMISTNSTIGTIICENGLTMAKLIFIADVPPYGAPWTNDRDEWEVSNTKFYNTRRVIDENHTNLLPLTNQRYPNGNENSLLGYAILIRKIDKDDDTTVTTYKKQDEGYQICCVAYRKKNLSGRVSWACVKAGNISNSDGAARVQITWKDGLLCQGSPLVFQDTGDFGIISYIDREASPPVAVLDRAILRVNKNTLALVLKEGPAGNPEGVEPRSPAIATMFTRTGLRP